MSLILRIPDVSFTNTSLPILRNDVIANNGTLDIFDALEPAISWPKQGDPTEGVDTWKSLVGTNTASFAGTTGWSNGFTIDATADTITMPSTFKRPANGKGVVIFWVKIGTQAFTSGTNNRIAGVGGLGGMQWWCYMNYQSSDANHSINMYSGNNAAQILTKTVSNLPASRVAQLAVSMEPVGGVYVYKSFFNGVKDTTFTSALASLPQPSGQMFFGGAGAPVNQTVLRTLVDDLTVTTPEALVALDYSANVSRLAV
jgi:hypothetical protein